MKEVYLGQVPASTEAKLQWCIDAIQSLALATRSDNPNVAADGFTIENVTVVRTLNANCGPLANLAAAETAIDATRDVLLTFISDLKKRGSKRQA